MSEKISVQDVDGKSISGHYVLRNGIVIVTASDGRTTRAAIEESMLFCSNCTGTGHRLMISDVPALHCYGPISGTQMRLSRGDETRRIAALR
jgi:hypothetical protein